MTITDRLLITIIGGAVLWMLKEVVTYFVRRNRVLCALESDISFQQSEVNDDLASVTALFDSGMLKTGNKISFPLKYNPEPHMVLNAYLSCLPNFVRSKSLIRIFKFYDAVSEFESALAGFCDLLCLWEQREKKLDESDIKHLKTRLDRMKSIANAITQKSIESISELPEDYRCVQNLEATIKSNA